MGLRLIPDNVIRLGRGLGGASVLSVMGGGAQQSTLLNGLYACWKLNESGNVNRADSVGGSTMVPTGTVNSGAGLLGNGAVFVGNTANYLSCDHNADLSPAGTSWTIALWIKWTAGNMGFIAKYTGGGAGGPEYIIDAGSTGGVRLLHYGFAPGSVTISGLPGDTNWHAIRAGFNKATLKSFIQFDAAAMVEQAVTGALNVSDNPVRIGVFDGSSRPMNGTIDHVHFWKRVLTDAEWIEFYNGGAGKDFIP